MKRVLLVAAVFCAIGASPASAENYRTYRCSNSTILRVLFNDERGTATVVPFGRPSIRLQRTEGDSANFRYTRRAHELPMLKRYHRKLVRHGVRDYDFAALFSDYRACLPISLYVAVSWCAEPADVERMKGGCLPDLQRALRALIDHAA